MADFQAALERFKELAGGASNDDKLRAYSLFKQASVGDCDTPQPGRLDAVGRAKWTAWSDRRGTSREEAMRLYVALVKELDPSWAAPAAAAAAAPEPVPAVAAPPASAPAPATEQPPKRVKRLAGALYKQRDHFHGWRLRHFVLHDKMLSYYRSKGDAQPRGQIYLEGCGVEVVRSSKEGYFPFVINHPASATPYRLSSTSEERTRRWVEALRTAASAPAPAAGADAALPPDDEDEAEDGEDPAAADEFDDDPVAGLDDDLRRRVDEAVARLVNDASDESLWTASGEKDGVRAFTRRVDGNLAARGVGTVPHPARKILQLILNIGRKGEYDAAFDRGRRVRVLGPHTFVDYVRFKAVFPTKAREFCNLVHWRVLDSGDVVIAATGFETPECPPERGTVRGHCVIGGWRIRPSAAGDACEVTYAVESTLGGSIPAFVANQATAQQPLLVLGLRNVLDRSPTSREDARPLTNGEDLVGARQARARPAPAPAPKTGGAGAAPPVHAPDRTLPSHTPEPFSPLAALPLLVPAALWWAGVANLFVTGALAALAAIRVVDAFMGGSRMSTRRKLMIASWSAPSAGVILGQIQVDFTKAQRYIEAKRAETGQKVTVTHLVIKALGMALKNTPSVNGRIVWGRYYPAESADVGVLVNVDGGKDLANAKIERADEKPVEAIAEELRAKATASRTGQDKDFEAGKPLIRAVPTWLLRHIIYFVGWLGSGLGVSIKALGVQRHPFGSCMVTSIGAMGGGLDSAFAPLTPWAHNPMILTVGEVVKKAVVAGPDDRIVVRPMLTLAASIDHRYVDGAGGARMAKMLREYLEEPSNLDHEKQD